MKSNYAKTDNLYLEFYENKIIYKHVFMPNPQCGLNSSYHIKYNTNEFMLPCKRQSLYDNTKNEFYDKQETI